MSRVVGLLTVVVMLASCNASTPSGGKASPSTPSATLSCRLPVTWVVEQGAPPKYAAGFLSLPARTLTADPSAPVHSTSYDAKFSKWLPVPLSSVSTDGSRYAYGDGNAYQNLGGKLHLVDVASGTDTVLFSSTSTVFSVVVFAPEGIYITRAAPEGYHRGLWLEDLGGGTPRLISQDIVAPAIGGGWAWGVTFNKADPRPGPGGIEGPMNQVLRIDLATGSATPWFYVPGSSVLVLGFDLNGKPIVSAGYPPAANDPTGKNRYEVWVLGSATAATKVFSSSEAQLPLRLSTVDAHGSWFDSPFASATTSYVWLYARGSIQSVAIVDVGGLAVAGGCLS
jgi:hypothetical protein